MLEWSAEATSLTVIFADPRGLSAPSASVFRLARLDVTVNPNIIRLMLTLVSISRIMLGFTH
jgi:hypothetical protein